MRQGLTLRKNIRYSICLLFLTVFGTALFGQVGAIDTFGRALVFIPDPCTKANVFYGDLFEDNNDAHAEIFDSLVDTVVLKNIRYKDGLFYLEGPYVKIEDIEPNPFEPVVSSNGDFFFTRDESGFEDVMAYYHIDSFQRYVQSLGFTDLYNRPLRVDPHGFAISDQSRFVPNGADSYLLFGEGGVDDAEDADVLIHEYIHALSEDAAPGTNIGCERKGIDEGYADYFAAAYSKMLNEFDWENIFNWDGHNPFGAGRTVTSAASYPLDFCNITNLNDWGELWASSLISIRKEVGDTIMDRVVLQSLYGSFVNMSFEDAARQILKADSILYDGAHIDNINFEFCSRGIFSGSQCLSVSRPLMIGPRSLAIKADRFGGSIQWNLPTSPKEVHLHMMDLHGRTMVLSKVSGKDQIQWKRTLSPGIYIIRLEFDKQSVYVGKVNISH